MGTVTDAGPAWGLRGGVELLPWLALEAHYVGMYNSATRAVLATTLVTLSAVPNAASSP